MTSHISCKCSLLFLLMFCKIQNFFYLNPGGCTSEDHLTSDLHFCHVALKYCLCFSSYWPIKLLCPHMGFTVSSCLSVLSEAFNWLWRNVMITKAMKAKLQMIEQSSVTKCSNYFIDELLVLMLQRSSCSLLPFCLSV